MPIAALPEYLQKQDFSTASPGLRYGMYLRLWGIDERSHKPSWDTEDTIYRIRGKNKEERKLRESNKRKALNEASKLCHFAKDAMAALALRQQALFSRLDADSTCALYATAIAPFSTGLGNEHPLENGFAFLWPYGLPYLPGSGVKGVLRQSARELAEGIWGDTCGWTEDAITALFGSEDSNDARRGALTFWDVIPQIRGDALAVEVMTPHQTHYYQGKEPPHDSGSPNPIYFLTVPPESGFDFYVTCNPALLNGTDFRESWRELLQAAFGLAFDWLGFGAKTAVGYGAMRVDQSREEAQREQAEKEAMRRQREAELKEAVANLPDDAAHIEKFRRKPEWEDTNLFLEMTESILSEYERLSPQACQRLHEEMNKRWPGILQNPEATQGKKKKPKYKPRTKALAMRILELCTK